MDSPAKPPRRRDAVSTKARILAAAKQCFSTIGYTGTGIRDIAAVAGVSYTMLGRYFGSKAGLFEAALIDGMGIEPIMAADRSEFGANFVRVITRNLTDGHQTAMTHFAAGDPIAREIVLRVVEERVVRPLADWLGEPNARERTVAIMMLGGGFVIYSRQLPFVAGPLGIDHPIVRWLAASLQQIVDNPTRWQDAPAAFAHSVPTVP